VTTITMPEHDHDAHALASEATSLIPNAIHPIESADDYELYGARIRDLRSAEKKLDEKRKDMTRPLDEAKRTVMDWFRAPIDRLQAARSQYEDRMREWDREQERLRREAQARAEEAARKERERLAKEAAEREAREREAARKAREAAEARAKAEEAKGRAELAEARRRAAQEAEEARIRQAAEQAEEARRLAELAPAVPVVEAERPKVAGMHTRKAWKWRVTDEAKVPRQYLMLDTTKIGKVVRALGAEADIEGVEVYEDQSYVTRAAR
jgi:chromosome segregation ATPase